MTPGLNDTVEDLRDRVDNLEDFVTSKTSDATGFMDVGDPYTIPGRSTRVKTSHSQKVKHPARMKHRHMSHVGHQDQEDGDHTSASSSSSSPDSERSNKDTTRRNGDSTSSNSRSSSDDHQHKSRSRKSSKSKHPNRSTCTQLDETTHVVPDIHIRRKGPKHKGLKELRPTNLLFRSLLRYRTYRFGDLSDQRTPRGTSKIKDHIKRFELTMRGHTFHGEDPIHLLDYFAHFVRDADTLKMSEAQTCIAVPYFLRGNAEQQFNTVRGSTIARDGGVAYWLEVLQYLLRSYATSPAISGAIRDLRDTRQHPGETETGFITNLNTAFYYSGNVHTSEKMFVDGLDPVVKTLVEQRREESRRINYLQLVQYARAEGEPNRARLSASRRSTPMLEQENHSWKPVKPPRWAENDKVMFAESTADSRESPIDANQPRYTEDEVHVIGEADSSIPTDELPTTLVGSSTTTADPLLAVQAHVPAPHVNNQEWDRGMSRNRPGWKTPYKAEAYGRRPAQPRTTPICHEFYRTVHISPRCTNPIADRKKFISNYASLTEMEGARMQATACFRAKAEFPPNGSPIHNGLITPPQINGAQSEPQRDESHPVAIEFRTIGSNQPQFHPAGPRETSRGTPE